MLDQDFKSWILSELSTAGSVSKGMILHTIRFDPELALQIISQHLWDWGLQASFKSGRHIPQNENSDPSEILQAMKEHFAEELARIK